MKKINATLLILFFLTSCNNDQVTLKKKGVDPAFSHEINESERLIQAGLDSANDSEKLYEAYNTVLRKKLFDAAEFLLKKGVDIDKRDDFLMTPLMDAAIDGEVETVKFFLKNGADINAKDEFEKTALIYAVSMGKNSVTKLLIEKGADINVKNYFCKTALFYAEERKNVEIVEFLLKKGAKQISSYKCKPQFDYSDMPITPLLVEFRKPFIKNAKKFIKMTNIKLHCEKWDKIQKFYPHIYLTKEQLREIFGLKMENITVRGAGNRKGSDAHFTKITNSKELKRKFKKIVQSFRFIDDPKFEITDQSSPKFCRDIFSKQEQLKRRK